MTFGPHKHPAEIVAGHILDDPATRMKTATLTVQSLDANDVVAERATAVLSRSANVLHDQLSDRLIVVCRIDGELLGVVGEHGRELACGHFGEHRDGHVVDRVVHDRTGQAGIRWRRVHVKSGEKGGWSSASA